MTRRWSKGDVVGNFTLLAPHGRTQWRARCQCGRETRIIPAQVLARGKEGRPSVCRACAVERRREEAAARPRLCPGCGTTEEKRFPRRGGRGQCMACEAARNRNGECRRCGRPQRLTRVCPCFPPREVPAERLRLLKKRHEAMRARIRARDRARAREKR